MYNLPIQSILSGVGAQYFASSGHLPKEIDQSQPSLEKKYIATFLVKDKINFVGGGGL